MKWYIHITGLIAQINNIELRTSLKDVSLKYYFKEQNVINNKNSETTYYIRWFFSYKILKEVYNSKQSAYMRECIRKF